MAEKTAEEYEAEAKEYFDEAMRYEAMTAENRAKACECISRATRIRTVKCRDRARILRSYLKNS